LGGGGLFYFRFFWGWFGKREKDDDKAEDQEKLAGLEGERIVVGHTD